MHHRAIIILLFLSATISRAQHVNVYANPNWVQDSLVGFSAPIPFGLNYRLPLHHYKLDSDFLPDIGLDSNSFSRIRYSMASNQNQFFTAGITRPVSDHSDFTIGLIRISNIGWMSSSHARITSGTASANHRFGSRLSLNVEGQIFIADKEQNGGLRRDDYSIRQQEGLLSNITNDVLLSGAYNRHDHRALGSRLDYKVSKKLSIWGHGGFSQKKFSYLDGFPNLNYYDSLQDDTNNRVFSDSASLTTWHSAVGASFSDSLMARNWTLGANVNLGSSTYLSNGRIFYASNVALNGSLEWLGSSDDARFELGAIPIGYNAGDYLFKGHYQLHWRRSTPADSVKLTGVSSALDVRFQNARPAMIFEQYQSSIVSFDNDLGKIGSLDLNLSNRFQKGGLGLYLDVFYQSRTNFVYINDSLDVEQFDQLLSIAGTRLRASIETAKHFASADLVYQENLAEALYSVPDFTLEAIYAYSFPMFRKSIYLQAGMKGFYFSPYHARGYVPFLDMMYVQNNRLFGDYSQFDPFAKVTIQTVDVTFKAMNVAYGVFSNDPIVAPGYPSVPRFFELTIDWRFKN